MLFAAATLLLVLQSLFAGAAGTEQLQAVDGSLMQTLMQPIEQAGQQTSLSMDAEQSLDNSSSLANHGGPGQMSLNGQARLVADPPEGTAPFATVLSVEGIDPSMIASWELDRDGDGVLDGYGVGTPLVVTTYYHPGLFFATFVLRGHGGIEVARACGIVTVTGQDLSGFLGYLPSSLRIDAYPSEGLAPLDVVLDGRNIAPSGYQTWSLDQYGDGAVVYPGGQSISRVRYDLPGVYNSTMIFYDSAMNEMMRGCVTIRVRSPIDQQGSMSALVGFNQSENSSGAPDESGGMSGFVGSKEASLHLTPKGGGGVGSSNPSSSLDGSPKAPVKPKAIGNGSDWMPPNEGSSELIDPSLAAFPEKGFAPLDVRFDASKSSAVNGIVLYNFDLIWGPDDDPDDGYYEKSGSDPYWTRRIAEPGLYKAVVDVEDGKGNRARAAKAIWITYSEKNLGARIEANVTEGPLPLTVRFRAVPQAVEKEDAAVYAYWDFDTRDIGEMVGGDIAVYGTVVHTFESYGSHRVGVTLMDKDRNAGNMSTIDIMAYYGAKSEAPKG